MKLTEDQVKQIQQVSDPKKMLSALEQLQTHMGKANLDAGVKKAILDGRVFMANEHSQEIEMTEKGKAEFEEWRDEYLFRVWLRHYAHPDYPNHFVVP